MTEQERNLEVARRIPVEAFGEGKLELLDELISPDFRDGDYPDSGIEAIRALAHDMRSAFPDLAYTVDFAVAEGDMVLERIRATATHTGTYYGIPATGKKLEWVEMQGGRFRDGQMYTHWAIVDTYSMYKQMGVITE